MKIGNGKEEPERIDLNMMPMIDVCFQLLIFFMLTLKILTPEGDFDIKMPIAAPSEGKPEDTIPPIKVRLVAGTGGKLAQIRMGDRSLKNFKELRDEIIDITGGQGGPGTAAESMEVELDCDYALRYEYVVDAITAVSGYKADDGRTIVKLIEKIKFSPARGGDNA